MSPQSPMGGSDVYGSVTALQGIITADACYCMCVQTQSNTKINPNVNCGLWLITPRQCRVIGWCHLSIRCSS